MYSLAYDPRAGLVVAVAAGALTKADHERAMRAVARLDHECMSLKGSLVTILVAQPDAGLPTAEMRKEYAESQGRMVARRHLFLLVTTSMAVRGVMTAVQWLRAPNQKFHTEAFATFEQATRLAERDRGETLPQLTWLLAEAQRGKMAHARVAENQPLQPVLTGIRTGPRSTH